MLQNLGLTEAMRLFMVRSDLAFSSLRPVTEDAWQWRGGEPISGLWRRSELTVADGREREFIPVDCLELITGVDGFILSDFARDKLQAVLSPAGEFWPVTVVGRAYWWFNCTACVDALDQDATDADWSVVNGEWGEFRWITSTRRLAFKAGKVAAAPVTFRIPEYPQGVLLATEVLLKAVQRHGLTGFAFDEIWSEAEGGVVDPPGIGLATVFDRDSQTDVHRQRASALSVLERRARFRD